MKCNKVTLRSIGENEHSIDFFHPIKSRGRIRRKIKVDALTAQKIQCGIEFLISKEVFYAPDSKEFARQNLLTDSIFYNNSFDTIDLILEIFYSNTLNNSTEFESYLDQKIPLPTNTPRVIFLGKFGVGKSTIIKKITNFAENINFPFIDISETTTYKTEYIFRNPDQMGFRFAVSLLPFDSLKQQIENCIHRAINSKIDYLFDNDKSPNEEDVIMSSFISDPNNTFDLRFLMGSYYKINSKLRQKELKKDVVEFWSKVYEYINMIFKDIKNNNLNFELDKVETSDSSNKEFLKYKYYEYLLNNNVLENSNYNKLINYIISEILNVVHSNKSIIKTMPFLQNIEFTEDSENNWYTGFYCEILNYDNPEFENFIKIFTSREGKDFRKILTTLVNSMRIELPFGDNILPELKKQPIILIDTVGFTSEDNSSIKNSTNFNLDKIDIITVVDDSKSSMSSATQNILKHLFHRVLREKIFIAYTFFDEFSKSEFIEDEEENENSITEKKCNYLCKIQGNKICNILKDDQDYKNNFIKNIEDKTFFISSSKHPSKESYYEINKLLFSIIKYYKKSTNYLLVDKYNKNKDLIVYDFKKLTIIFYKEIRKKYIEKQTNIYINNPPHYKITESLTYRLSQGETYFCGSITLKPIDDLYSIMIDSLSSFILNPQDTNFYTDDADDNANKCKIRILEKLNELTAEKLSILVLYEFTNTYARDKWNKLYLESNIGSDFKRRLGIIQTINEIIPPIEIYMSLNSKDNWIDKIENIIKVSIAELDDLIKKEKQFKSK